MRPFIRIKNSAIQGLFSGNSTRWRMGIEERALGKFVSGKLREIFLQRAAQLAGKKIVHRRNGAGRLVERNAFDAMHGKENRGEPHALAIRLIHLAKEMVEGIQVDAAQRD